MSETFWGLSPTAWIALLTVALTLIAVAQVCVYARQAGYMRDGLAETNKAAEAAKLSADIATSALNMTHRPKLVVRHVVVEGFDEDGHVGTELTNGYVLVTNVGVLPATLFKVYTEWLFAETLPIENPALKAIDSSTRRSRCPLLPSYESLFPIVKSPPMNAAASTTPLKGPVRLFKNARALCSLSAISNTPTLSGCVGRTSATNTTRLCITSRL